MCGIAGIVGTDDSSYRADVDTLRLMCDSISHRGPDDEGFYVSGRTGLGMRRLSIIDLASGHQPIHNETKTVWIVYNGEIYNFPELRADLEKRGHKFYTNTDTETVVHLYEEYGTACVQKLRGMFAFAIQDLDKGVLLLARDRLGKKPLHYVLVNGRLLFGSEIKSLLAVEPGLAEENRSALPYYFAFGYIPDPLTAFSKIRKLPPGHLLVFQQGRIKVERYWELPAYGTTQPRDEEECVHELEHGLQEAVRIRLVSDVPLGALLSGGTDSSLVLALMAKASSRPVKTFSIGFARQEFNEARYARMVAEAFATEHQELIVDADVGSTLEFLAKGLEEPFADSSIIPTYHVCRLARQHVTVALSGDGGDELFAGYERYGRAMRPSRLTSAPAWAHRLYRSLGYPLLPSGVYGRRLLYNAGLSFEERYIDSLTQLGTDRDPDWFTPEFLAESKTYASPAELFRERFRTAPAKQPLERLLYVDTMTYLPFDILTKVDRMSMATSLEVRVPLLDHVIVEWVTRLPLSSKWRHGGGKYLLKKLAEKVGVPREVLYRPKQGFALPLVHWMRHELKRDLLDILLEPRALQRGYVRPTAVRQLVEEHCRGRRDRSSEIWLLLMLELWYRNFIDARPAVVSPVPAGTTTSSVTT